VTTFAIVIVRGYRPGTVEILGALITIGALVAANMLTRRRAPRLVVETDVELAEAA